MFEQENVDSQRLAMLGIFGALAIFVVIVGVQVLFYRLEKADIGVKDTGKPRDLVAVQTEQVTSLSTYRWVDKEKDIVTVPIKRAMQLEVERLAGVRP